MDDIGRFPYPVVCYCATCNRIWAWGKNEFLGFEFTCPNERGDKHLARLVLDEPPAFCWLQIEWLLYRWQTHISPGALLNRVLGRFGWRLEAEHLMMVWFLTLLLALLSESHYIHPFSSYFRPFLLVLIAWRLVDLILINVSITFTSKFPANRLRSVILTFAGYIQVILVYAYLYATMGKSSFPKYGSVSDAVWFSFGTIVTVGYGNLNPTGFLPRFVVVSELILGLFFVVIVIAQVAAWVNQPRHSNGEFSLDHVRLQPDIDG